MSRRTPRGFGQHVAVIYPALMLGIFFVAPFAIMLAVSFFFTTTLVFGKTEVIGHTLIHAALAVLVPGAAGLFAKRPLSILGGSFCCALVSCRSPRMPWTSRAIM